MRDFLLNDLTKRWDTAGNVLKGMAAFVDPRHKSLEWLKRHQQHTIQKQLLEEFSRAKLIQQRQRQRWNLLPQRLEACHAEAHCVVNYKNLDSKRAVCITACFVSQTQFLYL